MRTPFVASTDALAFKSLLPDTTGAELTVFILVTEGCKVVLVGAYLTYHVLSLVIVSLLC